VATIAVAVVAVMMVVVVGFGSSFFCPAAAAAVLVVVVEIISAAKNEHKTGPDSLRIGPCFHPSAVLTIFLSWSHIGALVFASLTRITDLFPFHALIINFVYGITIYN
jgi:hypothetical protein